MRSNIKFLLYSDEHLTAYIAELERQKGSTQTKRDYARQLDASIAEAREELALRNQPELTS